MDPLAQRVFVQAAEFPPLPSAPAIPQMTPEHMMRTTSSGSLSDVVVDDEFSLELKERVYIYVDYIRVWDGCRKSDFERDYFVFVWPKNLCPPRSFEVY